MCVATVIELQNNRVLRYEGCFGFHRVVNAKESRLYERDRNIIGGSHVQTYVTPSVLMLGGFWAGR